MDPTRFELSLTLSPDERFAATVRDLAVHAAQYAGCAEAEAVAFGNTVEQAARATFEGAATDAFVPVVVRRQDGPVEVVIDSHTLAITP